MTASSNAVVDVGGLPIPDVTVTGSGGGGGGGATSVSGAVTGAISGTNIPTTFASGNFGSLPISTSGSLTLSALTTGILHAGVAGLMSSSLLVNADVSTTAAIAVSKLAAGTSAQVLMCNATPTPTWTSLSGDVTIGATGAVTIGAGKVTGSMLASTALVSPGAIGSTTPNTVASTTLSSSGLATLQSVQVTSLSTGIGHYDGSGVLTSSTLVNADVSASAAIVASKLAGGTDAQLLLTSTTTPTWATLSGDATITNAGALTIGASKITATKCDGTVTYQLTGDCVAASTKVGASVATVISTLTGTAGVVTGPTTALKIGSNPSATGLLRLSNAFSINQRNSGNSGDQTMMSADSSGDITIGNGGSGQWVQINVASMGGYLQIGNTNNVVRWQGTTFAIDRNNAGIFQLDPRVEDSAPNLMTLAASSAYASATGTNRNGGNMRIKGGAPTTIVTAGLRGAVQISAGALDADILIAATEVVAGQRVVALCRLGALTSTEMPASTGDGVIFVGDAATNTAARPVSGFIHHSRGGVPCYYGSSALTQSTVGAAGGASALPITPSAYEKVYVDGSLYVRPLYAAA